MACPELGELEAWCAKREPRNRTLAFVQSVATEGALVYGISPFPREAVEDSRSGLSGKKHAQERPLHQVERALRTRFRLGIQRPLFL